MDKTWTIDNEEQWLDVFLHEIEPKMRGEVSEDNWHPTHSLEEVLSSPYADLSYVRVYSYDEDEYDMIFSNPMLLLLMETDSLRHVSTLLSRAWNLWMNNLEARRTLNVLHVIHGLPSNKMDEYKISSLFTSFFEKSFIESLKADLVELSEKSTASDLASVLLRWQWFFSLRKELGEHDSSPTLDFAASLLNA